MHTLVADMNNMNKIYSICEKNVFPYNITNMSSYVLDRDLLGSARNTSWLDANSNQLLLGNGQYQRADNDTRKMVADLQDQLRMLKHDVEKKDSLISELSSVKEIEKIRGIEAAKLDAIFSVERVSADNAKREAAALHVKCEALSNDLCEAKVKIQAKEERLNEYKREIESLKSDNAALNALIGAQRNKVKELETDLGSFETVANKSGITISALQKENKDYQQRILELESRIRTHMDEREGAERKTDVVFKKLDELANHLTTITGTAIPSTAAGLDIIIAKVTDIVNENSMIKGKFMTNTEKLTSCEAEAKANRETIQRLVNELNKFEKDSVATKLLVDNLKAERDSGLNTKSLLEKEIDALKDRLNNIQTAWQATRTELETKEGKYAGIEANLKQLEYDSLYSKNCLGSFRDQVATLLSDGFVKVEPNEEQIKEKIKLLMTSSKDRGLMIASMDGKMQQLANQLTDQIQIYKELENKYQRAESKVADLEGRLVNLDSEYCATEVIRDTLKSDKIKYLTFLERVGGILKINQISADVGVEMNIDVILARIEQLVKSEHDSIQDKQTNIYNLQRKVKSLKEQLDNKELHLDLLRKKLSALEEERNSKSSLEREVDDHVMMSKKLKVKVDKLTQQLNDLKTDNTELKAQLLDANNLKGRQSDQEKEINSLLNRINDLEADKSKYLNKIAKLKDDIENAGAEASKTRSSSDNAVTALSQELRQFKVDLDRLKQREKQLLDFRDVIARMLGLDVNSIAVPDYEIISRIERLVATVNNAILHTQASTVPLSTLLVPGSTPIYTVNRPGADQDYTSSSTFDVEPVVEPHSSKHRHHRHHHRSPSPSRRHHHHHNHHSHNNRAGDGSSPTNRKQRSPSPRKVTIDPNSY